MNKIFIAGLAASFVTCAQSSIAAPTGPVVSAGRDFTCILRTYMDAPPRFASCIVDRPVLGQDQKTVAIQKGWRLNGFITESGNKILWTTLQASNQAWGLGYGSVHPMTSVFSAAPRVGDTLTVTVSHDIDFPQN